MEIVNGGLKMKTRGLIAIIIILSLILVALSLSLYVMAKRGRAASNTFLISYLDSGYERAPNSFDLSIPKDEDEAFLKNTLEAILDRDTRLTDEEKSIRILKYIASFFVSAPNDGSATKVIRDGFALCGGKSEALVMLCRKAEMPARYVGSMYMPSLRSHALGEVFYDGRWHLYDATYGIFLYSNRDYDGKGYVISFHDLISNPNAGTVFKVVPEAGAGKYDDNVKRFPITRLDNESSEDNEDGKLVGFYRKEMNEAFPVAYGSNDIVSYPVDANLLQNTSQWFGQVDDSDRELAEYEVRFSGSHYVGNSMPPAFHTWLIKASPYTTINIEYYSAQTNPPKLCLVPLRGARVSGSRYEDKKAVFTVYVNDSEAILSVYCPRSVFSVDAMHVYR